MKTLIYEQIKELIKSISSSSLRIFELESDDIKLKLSENEESSREVSKDSNSSGRVISQVENDAIVINNEAEIKEESVDIEDIKNNSFKSVKSPLVGILYSSGTPDGKSYVEMGSKVKKGGVLCIVEAMKIMNEITAEEDYEIVEILRSNKGIVEFGVGLFEMK